MICRTLLALQTHFNFKTHLFKSACVDYLYCAIYVIVLSHTCSLHINLLFNLLLIINLLIHFIIIIYIYIYIYIYIFIADKLMLYIMFLKVLYVHILSILYFICL